MGKKSSRNPGLDVADEKRNNQRDASRKFKQSIWSKGYDTPVAFSSPWSGCCGTGNRPEAVSEACCSCCDKFAHLRTTWSSSVCSSCTDDLGFCCYALWCPCCTTYSHRKTLLNGDIEANYSCCQRKSCLDTLFCVSACPSCCLCMEVCLFPNIATIVNRDLIQQLHQVRSTGCDKAMVCCALICSATRSPADNGAGRRQDEYHQLPCNPFACILWACIQTQHELELRTPPHLDNLAFRDSGHHSNDHSNMSGFSSPPPSHEAEADSATYRRWDKNRQSGASSGATSASGGGSGASGGSSAVSSGGGSGCSSDY